MDPVGIEPTTSCLQSRRYSQLSYGPLLPNDGLPLGLRPMGHPCASQSHAPMSTVESVGAFVQLRSRPDSNRDLPASEASALSNWATRTKVGRHSRSASGGSHPLLRFQNRLPVWRPFRGHCAAIHLHGYHRQVTRLRGLAK